MLNISKLVPSLFKLHYCSLAISFFHLKEGCGNGAFYTCICSLGAVKRLELPGFVCLRYCGFRSRASN
uniref:Uncharacterized protein n=1 Tax=Salix viminalis TaxID=40686 RepID=A0A6N2MAF4_SALVM